MRRFLFLFPLLATLALVFPLAALAADAGEIPNKTLPLPSDLVWSLVAAGLVPLGGYIINYLGPHTSEKIKGVIVLGLGAISSAIVQAITAGGVGFNDVTLQYVLLGLVAAFGGHKIFIATTVAQSLGAGRNIQDDPSR